MGTYLVTGCAGFIGSKVTEQLWAAGHTVVGIDTLNARYDVKLKYFRLSELLAMAGAPQDKVRAVKRLCSLVKFHFERFYFSPVDVENREALEKLFAKHAFDAVINLAACPGVRYSMENPFVYMTTNALGTLNLLEAMRAHGVKKFVLASTSSLYAGQQMPFTEDLPVNTPLSPYAVSKKSAELMAYSYHKLYGLSAAVLRYFTVFGPAGRPDMSVFRFIKWIDEGHPLEIFGDGKQTRDWTYVDDVARGTVLAALAPLDYEIINLGGGSVPVPLNEVIAFIENELGKKAKRTTNPFHVADIEATGADIRKARRLLGWEPQVAWQEGLRRTVAWYLKNRKWAKTVLV
jgi:nucleoside-diphosphate-sugar epimerase